MITIKSFTEQDEIKAAADLALKKRLYVSGWSLSSYLISARHYPEYCANIVLAFDDVNPVGVAISFKDDLMLSAVFVKKSYRRQNIGTQLLDELFKTNRDFKFLAHNKTNYGFFQSITNPRALVSFN